MEKINRLVNTEITERLEQLDKLAEEIGHFLSLSTENRIWPILKHHRLTLLTDDPHLAVQIRFQQNTLSKHLSKRLNLKISALHIKLISLPFASIEQKNNGFKLSNDTASVVRSIAFGIEDKELQEAIMHLAATASRERPAA
ncbi:MAG: hypothetical protein PHE17_04650 [Thiothrix sp.]|uniref:hypothetical protein n=1 Tax=Thiothrix sp. TaxID=1032 RepID=UPI0026042EBE|nr:hypothetical protein [Thiothrix sp.]MDD5392288.1 hypothetical protein [Thiothrix sp.]